MRKEGINFIERHEIYENGITLIALVITIIVLLILAGVSIATLTGPNGLLTRANEAKIETALGAVREALKLEQAGKIIDNEKLTPEILLSEGKISRTVQQGENDTYYMYYAIKEKAYEGMQGLGKGNISSLKDVFLIDDNLNVKYVASNGKEYGDNLDNKVLDDETNIKFSSKAFSEYVSQISGVAEDKLKFKWMKNLTELKITDSNVDSLQDLVLFPNLTYLRLEKLNLKNLDGIENCVKLQIFETYGTGIEDYIRLSELPELNKFYLLAGKKANFDNIIDSLKSVSTLKIFMIDATETDIKSMKRVDELSNNLEVIYLKTLYNIEKIEGLEKKTNLKSLYLGGNKIEKIEGLENCTNLKTLDLASNKITKIENLEQLQDLTTLFLASNQLVDILNVDKNSKLTNLDLRGNPNIKSNRSEYTEEEKRRLDKIQEIITVRNGTININPEQLQLFFGYKKLELNNQNISTLEFLEGQIELEYLSLAGCKNITLTDSKSQEILKKMKNLNTLDLQGTNVQNLTAINELKNLTTLTISTSNNLDLTQMEDIIPQINISGLKQEDINSILNCKNKEKITKLSLGGNINTFSELPNMEEFLNLNTLNLNMNKQMENFNNIEKYINLKQLHLADTNLHGRMIDFSQLKNLTSLNLRGNTLWDEDLENLKALKNNTNLTIDLSNNSIINATALLELNPNTNINLSGNVNLTKEAKEKLKGHFQERVTF